MATVQSDVLKQFMEHLRDKGKSPGTIRVYANDIGDFLGFAANSTDTHPQDLSSAQAATYLEHLRRNGRKTSTRARHVSSIRCFGKFLQARYLGKTSDLMHVPRVHVESTPPLELTPNQVEQLLNQPSGNNFAALRARAMLETLYSTGITSTELVNLNLEDIDSAAEVIHLRHGRAPRKQPIGSFALSAVADYVEARRQIGNPGDLALFISIRGSSPYQRLTRRGLNRIVSDCARKAGLSLHVSPRVLRHAYCHHLLARGLTVPKVQELLGIKHLKSGAAPAAAG